MVDRSLLQKLIWLRGSPAGGSSPSYEKTVGPSPIVSVSDAKRKPALSLIAGMEPVQDLHGYSNPWPAGGGKNMFDISQIGAFNENVTVTKTADSFTVTNNNGYVAAIFVKDDGENLKYPVTDGKYTISIAESIYPNLGVYGSTDGVTFSWLANGILSGTTSATFTVSGQTYVQFRCSCPANGGTVTIKQFQFEAGNAATSYAPYSNICPISGRTGVTATRTGKNLLDYSAFQQYSNWSDSLATYGAYQTSSSNKGYLLSTVPGTAYAISLGISSSSFPTYCYLCRANGSDTSERVQSFTTSSFGSASITFTAESGWIYYVRVGNTGAESSFTTQMEKVSSAQLELGSATTYDPYAGATYPVSWQSEAGTVYGGTLDVVSGVLTVTDGVADIGDINWTEDSNRAGVFYGGITGRKTSSNIIACSALTVNNVAVTTNQDNYISGKFSYGGGSIFARCTMYESASSFKTGMAGQKIIYELDTPQTYQLTPQTVQMLKGANNLWNDAGDSTVTYVGAEP